MAEKHRPRPLKGGAALRKMGEGVQGRARENLALGHGRTDAEVSYRLQPHLQALLAADFNHSLDHQVESRRSLARAEQNPAHRIHADPAQPRQRYLFLLGHTVEERAFPDRPQQILE